MACDSEKLMSIFYPLVPFVRVLLVAFAWLCAVVAHASPSFSDSFTQSCADQARADNRCLSGFSVLDCVGRSAQACMSTPGGDSKLGMLECLQQELEFWGRRLNAAYAKRMAQARAEK